MNNHKGGVNMGVRKLRSNKLWINIGSHIIASIAIGALFMLFIGRVYIVAGPSMEKNIFDRQMVYVCKVTYRFTEPKRGDIIVFKTNEGTFIKRVVAVSGDIIEERQGVIYLNNDQLAECYVIYRTEICWGPIEVPNSYYWVMGDNRQNSKDSRNCIGCVHKSEIIGKAIFRIWPVVQLGRIY